jgi:ElaB/YqjD/DUF883 family membrane-anchored ribosome-binding protein
MAQFKQVNFSVKETWPGQVYRNENIQQSQEIYMDNQRSTTEDHQDLITAAANATEEKVAEARNRLSAAMDAARETYECLQQKAVNGAKATDKVIRENPYQAIGIAFGVGALFGFLLSRRSRD